MSLSKIGAPLKKRYRRLPYIPGTLRAYWGICDLGDTPALVANGIKGDAGTLLHCWNRREIYPPLTAKVMGTDSAMSFMQELEDRGYDLTTLKFTIKKKQPE